MLSELNKLLLEKYPILYHTKAIHLLMAAACIWVIAFGAGYLFLDISYTVDRRISDFYFRSFFVILHVLLAILTVSLWAIHFYKHNPIRELYPIQKHYFTKLLVLIGIPFWLIGIAKTPFDLGAHKKFKHLTSKEELIQDGRTLNIGYPFFVTNVEDYGLEERSYPDPFPVKFFKRISDKNVWVSNENLNAYGDLSHLENTVYNGDYDYEYSGVNHTLYYNPKTTSGMYIQDTLLVENKLLEFLNDSASQTVIDSSVYVFYEDKNMFFDADSCESVRVFSHLVDLSGVKHLNTHSMYNFASAVFGYEELKSEEIQHIHDLVNRSNQQEIEQVISDVLSICNKYSIEHKHVNAKILAEYHVSKEFKDYNLELTGRVKGYGDKHQLTSMIGDLSPLETEIIKADMQIEFGDVYTLYQNFIEVYILGDWFDPGLFFILCVFALILSAFFIWFEFMEIKALLISIPVAGVLGVFFGIGMLIIDTLSVDYYERESYRLIYGVIYSFVLIGTTLYFVLNKKRSRMVASIGMNITYVLSTFILVFTMFVLNDLFITKYTDQCNHIIKVKPIVLEWVLNLGEFIVIPFGFIGVSLFYMLIKPWKAKKKLN